MIRIILISALLLSLPATANVVGVDTANFNPTSNGIDFVTVQSSETLEPGFMNFGLFFNYAVNTLPNYQNISSDGFNDKLLFMDLSFGLGLTKDWDIGVTVPQVLSQEVDESNPVFRGQFGQTGITEIRLNTKYRFFGDEAGGMAAIFTTNFHLIENFPFTGTNPGPTFNLELAYDFRWDNVAMAINGGYRLRNPGEPVSGVPVDPFPDEIIWSLAGSYLVSSIDTKFIAEIFGSVPTEDVRFTSDRELSSAEFLVGAKWDATRDIALHAGVGTEIYQGSASPDVRFYTGVNWAIGPIFEGAYQGRQDINFLGDMDFSQAPKTRETFLAKDVLFEFNSSRVSDSFRNTLRQLVDYIQKGKSFKSMAIIGHTDSVGSAAYNQDLSERRARSVRAELIKMLPLEDHSKIEAIGRGESQPIADNGNFQGRALNRRVEFNVTREI